MSAVTLRNMEQQEFSAYSQYFVSDYGQEIASNYGGTLESALSQAARELKESFPQGVPSPDNHLLCIEQAEGDQAHLIGYLWYTIEAKIAFIHDFFIYPTHRGSGYGKSSMANLERQLSEDGVTDIKLRVAQNNQRALKLYQAIGFHITGHNMAKKLGG